MITEAQTRRASKPLGSYLDAALIEAIGVAVYTTDATGRITLFNEAAVNLWGRKPEIGKDLWCGSWRIFTPAGKPMPLDQCPMATALRENRPVRDAEIVVERPDGTRANILPYPTPLRDETGRLIGAVNVLVDITERKRADAAASHLSAIVESSDDAIVSKDLDGTIKSWNGAAERIFGYAADEAVGKSIRIIVPEDRQHEEDEVLRRVGEGERIDHFETVRRRKDGSLVDISLTVSPIRNGESKIIGASKIARDIADRKQAEAALRQSMAAKDEFLSLVSHELRTPITTILGNSLLLLAHEGQLPEEDKRQALSDITSEAKRLEENLEHLLLLSRLDSRELELEPLSLGVLISKAADAFKEKHPGRCVSFQREDSSQLALGQETLVSLVIQNLLTNAAKYSDAETEIELVLRTTESGQIEVHVRDRGIGIEDDDRGSIFTPFFRSAGARKKASGLGLGLAVCKRAIEAQGGTIGVVSRPEGGSDFFFTLQAFSSVPD